MFLFTIIYFIITFFACSWFVHFLPGSVTHLFETLAHIFFTIAAAYLTLPTAKKLFYRKRVTSYDKAVLITGCDTGFGHQLAKRLDSEGFRVFASCLFPAGKGAETLKKVSSNRLCVLGLDVSDGNSVKEAVDFVQNNLNKQELWAVVNNAGILHTGFGIEWSSIDNFQNVLNVNTMGVVRVTKAFLPLLRKSKGRLITVTSICVNFTSLPYFSPYIMSKVASSCFCDSLRQQMEAWGIKVITVEPEAYHTAMTEVETLNKRTKESIKYIDETVREDYGSSYFEDVIKWLLKFSAFPSTETSKVIDDLYNAISLEVPDVKYKPCRNALESFMFHVMDFIPNQLLENLIRMGFYTAPRPQTVRKMDNQYSNIYQYISRSIQQIAQQVSRFIER